MKNTEKESMQVNLDVLMSLTGWDLETALKILQVDEKEAALIQQEMSETK
ncbi:MAG: hypothetical protein VZT48_11240 [Bulleidia sp.]|nr:hypothetical protein [Bulleidia sp.]